MGTKAIQTARNEAILEQGGACFWCGLRMKIQDRMWENPIPEMAATADHFVPAAWGGPNVSANIVAAHRCCNHRRGHSLPVESDMRRFLKLKGARGRFVLIGLAARLAGDIELSRLNGAI